MLERPRSRKTLQRAEQDTASLIVNRDASSRRSIWTDNLSRISKVFDFDIAILSSPVYERTFRDTVVTSLREHRKRKIASKTISIMIYTNDLDAQDRLVEELVPSDLLSAIPPTETSHETITFEWGLEQVKLFSMGQSKDPPTLLPRSGSLVVFLTDADCFSEHPADTNTNRKRSEILEHFKSLCSIDELKLAVFYIMFYTNDKHRSESSIERCVDTTDETTYLTYATNLFRRSVPKNVYVWPHYWRGKAHVDQLLRIQRIGKIADPLRRSGFL